MDGLPNLMDAALDARGNGSYLSEYAMQRYGSSRVKQVMPTESWYREHMPPVKAALEDGNLVDLPKDEDTQDDLRAVQAGNGVPRVPEQRSKAKFDSSDVRRFGYPSSFVGRASQQRPDKSTVRRLCRQRRRFILKFWN